MFFKWLKEKNITKELPLHLCMVKVSEVKAVYDFGKRLIKSDKELTKIFKNLPKTQKKEFASYVYFQNKAFLAIKNRQGAVDLLDYLANRRKNAKEIYNPYTGEFLAKG